jgi:hypothetical protein
MTVIACVDDNMGMCFNHRRQSRDREVCRRISELGRSNALRMNGYSAKLFDDTSAFYVGDDFFETAKPGDMCFFEDVSPKKCEKTAEKIILFRWNRRYPGDMFFDIDLTGWRLESRREFPGKSHETIAEEVYIR